MRAYWSNVSNNRFCRGNIIGWNGFSGQQLIFADNHLGGANCTSFYGLPEGSENIYWGNNYHENNFDGNNRCRRGATGSASACLCPRVEKHWQSQWHPSVEAKAGFKAFAR